MKICLVYKEDYPWDVRVEKIANSLAEAGHSVTIIARNRLQLATFEYVGEIEVVRLPRTHYWPNWLQVLFNLPFWFNPIWIWTIFKVIRLKKADIIIVRDLPLTRTCVLIGKLTGAKTIYDMAECYPLMYKSIHQFSGYTSINKLLKNSSMAYRYEKNIIHSFNHIWVMIEESRERLLKKGVSDKNVTIVSNTPSIANIRYYLHQHVEHKIRLVYVGFLSALRGLDVLINAVALCPIQERENIRLDIIGKGKQEGALRQQARTLGIDGMVRIHGWLSHEEVSKLLKQANVGVLPYRVCEHWNHTIPNKIFDYMLAALPVLATPVKPISRIINDAQCGVICRDNDPEDMAAKIIFLMDPDVRQKLGENGRRAVFSKYNWQLDEAQMVLDIEKIYRKFLNNYEVTYLLLYSGHSMRAFLLWIRGFLTRFFLSLMGLRIDYWRKKVESLWSLDEKELQQYLEDCLRDMGPKDSDGNPVENFQALRVSPTLSKSRLRKQHEDKIMPGSKFHRHTAGTSGEPTDIWLNRKELGRMLAVRDYCYRHCGIRLGDREARLWGRFEKNFKGKIKDFLLNRRIFHPVGDQLSDETKSLIRWRPTYIYGYASIIMECAREIERTGREIPGLHCVICTAETILPAQKNYLSNVFNCPVFEEYGATEFDIIAFECRRGHRHLVNPWLICETREDGQCLVTDVLRTSQSFVRYQQGDVLEFSHESCGILGSQIVLSEIKGRTIDRFAFIDEKTWFHAVAFSHAIDRYQRQTKEFFRFTIFQVEYGEFELFCDPRPAFGTESVVQFIERELAEEIGGKLTVKIGLGEVPEQSKHSYFVQLMTVS